MKNLESYEEWIEFECREWGQYSRTQNNEKNESCSATDHDNLI